MSDLSLARRYEVHVGTWEHDSEGCPYNTEPAPCSEWEAKLPHGFLDFFSDASDHVMLYRWADDIWYPLVDLA